MHGEVAHGAPPTCAVGASTTTERVDLLAREVLNAVHDTIRRHKVTYDEYNALKGWLIQVGQDGEWPLFCDVWIEHVVEEVASADRKGSKGTIEGPYYVPDAPQLGSDATLPMRDGEKGTPLTFTGQVRSVNGQPLADATMEIWQADADGYYAQFAPGIPEWNLRGTSPPTLTAGSPSAPSSPRPTRSRPTAPVAFGATEHQPATSPST